MKKHYDFTDARPNPYAATLKKSVTLRLGSDVLAYFKQLAEDSGIPCQTLINLYLRDCAQTGKEPDLRWRKPA